jgi:adenylate cyclase
MACLLRLGFILIYLCVTSLAAGCAGRVGEFGADRPSLSSVVINSDSTVRLMDGEGNSLQLLTLGHRENNILFSFSGVGNERMRFFLEGFDKRWTGWIRTSYKEYTNLPSGNFMFHAECMGDDGLVRDVSGVQVNILPVWYLSLPAIMIYLVLGILIIWSLWLQVRLRFARTQFMLEHIINERTEDLILEKGKTESLLANMLPKNTASELMAKGKATKIKYNFVTVLFSDIQGFTQIAEVMNPEVLIDELDKFFFYFDSVVEKYGIEKIKTIGDAYMCAGGIPEKNRTNPVEVILAALEMQAYMKRLKISARLEGIKYWDIRIGIHTGTVVAGVVGHKKLTYDIWGDTVNTASRMESSGEPGRINISGTTYEFVREFFECEYRGKMPVKYKGELEMYFVNGIIPELSNENGEPNKKFVIMLQKIKLQDIEDRVTKMFMDEAPPNLYFHNDVLLKNITNHVELLATAEKIADEDYINLKMASIFLLTGYITNYENPLVESLRMVEEILPEYGFSSENITETKAIIQNSYNDVQETLQDNILHDAVYDYLGRVDYIRLTQKLLREKMEYGKQTDIDQWLKGEEELLKEHEFKTQTGRLLRSVSVENQVKELLKSVKPGDSI